jgi:hypothetical protein
MLVSQRTLLLWVVAVSSIDKSHAFNSFPNLFGSPQKPAGGGDAPSGATEPEPSSPSTTVDLSIPYDAAAKLEYESWRQKFNKGDFDEGKYAVFKDNYEALTVANVIAAKEAREGKTDGAKRLELNEYADLSMEEYEIVMSGGSLPVEEKSGESVMSQVAAAAASQSEASTALGEAAASLAEEEEKLAKQLGLESVEEMEAALDAMDGIAADGGELDPTNVSREARVRAAYMDWCKEQGKEVEEARFATFSVNYLAMEEYAKENNVEMKLNEYADCTEEEYIALTTGGGAAEKEAAAPVDNAEKEAA